MNAYKEIELDKKTYEFSYSICENPHCNCYGINISLGSNINFFLDFATESVKNDSNNNEIIKFFLDFIKNDNEINLECLKKEYLFVKDLAKGKQNTIQSFSLGEFMVYRDIIWNEDDLNMNYEDKNYVIIDSYCVSPKCYCQEALLHFFDASQKEAEEPDFSFVYDYKSDMFKDATGISDYKVKQIIKLFPHTFNNEFKRKHILLKEEVKEIIQEKIENSIFGKRKLGRNEPCYCGSDLKYKKCCMNKDIEKFGKTARV